MVDTNNGSRERTIKQLIHFLKDNELHVTKSNNEAEPAIPIMVLLLLAKTMQDSLQAVGELMNKAVKAAKEEDQVTLELKNYMADQYSDSHQTYKQRLVDISHAHDTIVDLELDHENIRKEGNIMEYEKKTQIQNTLHQNRVNNLWDKMEYQQRLLRNTYNIAQPTQEDITQLHYQIANARKLISDLHLKYTHYRKKDRVTIILNQLKDTLNSATSKLKELESVDNKTQPNPIS